MKKPVKSVFLGNLGTRTLAFHRNIDRLKEIQKNDPSFNYKDNDTLKYYLNSLQKDINELKKIGVKE